MTCWLRLLAALLLLALASAGSVTGQESPMAVLPIPADDEPEGAAPETPAPQVPAAASVATPAIAYPQIEAPLPPLRPFAIARPGASEPAGRKLIADAPAPPPRPAPALPAPAIATAPQPDPSPPAPPLSAPAPEGPGATDTPDMRIASLPSALPPFTTQRSTTEEIEKEEEKAPEPMLVEKQTDAVDIACLQPALMRLIRISGEHFKATPVITSGQRNRGRRGSLHRRCMAADFFIPGIERARLARYLRSLPGAGGVGTYCHTKSVHLDIGDPRNWWQCGMRFRFAQR